MSEKLCTEELINRTLEEMRELYLRDDIPWVVGFSGGKDSSTVVQLVYQFLMELPPEERHKSVHVIASDTLVESPVVEQYLGRTLAALREGAECDGLPVVVQKVVPDLVNTFWVMMLGRGYPAPNRFFRWCTERLKIDPATRYIQQQLNEWGSVIILLGARKQESNTRAQVLENHRIQDSVLRRHSTMAEAFVYTPIADWFADDVWGYLISSEAPWNPALRLNSELRELYRDAAGGECPLVIDTTTPSCGQSRFGCWTCTVVTVDASMEGFLDVGGRYEWMAPLLDFRNKLKAYRDDPTKRERWRRNDRDRPRGWAVELGQIQAEIEECQEGEDDHEKILGPFKLEVRQELLQEVLELQKKTGYTLIQEEELDLIRRHWTEDYRVGNMAMLEILEKVYGPAARKHQLRAERELLEQVCLERGVDSLAVDRLLDLERGYVTKLRKRGLIQAIDEVIESWSVKEDSVNADT